MKSPARILFGLAALLVAGSAQAAFITASASAPTVDGADIAIIGTGTRFNGNNYIWSDRPTQGQTFTTLSNTTGYSLTKFSFYNIQGNRALLSAINFRVRNSAYTVIRDETGNAPCIENTWVTATLATPLYLAPNTTYAIEFQSFTNWPGIDGTTWDGFCLAGDSTTYAGGTAYSKYSDHVSTESYSLAFHANLTANSEVSPIPEPGSMLGLGCLVGAGAFLRTRRRNG